jgi:hypothetical protein
MRSSRDLQAQPVASQDAMPARVELKAQHLLLPGLHAWIRSLDGIGEGDRDAVLVHVAQPDEKVSMGIIRTHADLGLWHADDIQRLRQWTACENHDVVAVFELRVVDRPRSHGVASSTQSGRGIGPDRRPKAVVPEAGSACPVARRR